MEDAGLRRGQRRTGDSKWLVRLPVGRERQVEHRGKGQCRPRYAAAPEPEGLRTGHRGGELSVLRRHRARSLDVIEIRGRDGTQHSRAQAAACRRKAGGGGEGVRPAGGAVRRGKWLWGGEDRGRTE